MVDSLLYISWLLFIIAVTGAILNIKKKAACFLVWTLSNAGWVLYNLLRGESAQAAQNLIFLSTSIYGVWEWSGHKTANKIPVINAISYLVFHNSKMK